MGNTSSQSKYNNLELIELIAANYATTLNLHHIKDLSKPSNEYNDFCNNIIIVSSELLKKSLKPIELKYLENRVQNGINLSQQDLSYITKEELHKTSNNLSVDNKNSICKKISSFYLKIAHLYGAIVRVIEPSYKIQDNLGNEHNKDLLNAIYTKSSIPKNSKIIEQNISLCKRRITSLFSENLDDLDLKLSSGKEITLKQRYKSICSVNILSNNKQRTFLQDEFGILELERLYYVKHDDGSLSPPKPNDTNYNEYAKTLIELYELFSGKKLSNSGINEQIQELHDKNINSFGSIPLRNYFMMEDCRDDATNIASELNTRPSDNDKAEKIKTEEYLKHVFNMNKETMDTANEILDQLNKIFQIIQIKGENKVIINPRLTEDNLDKIIYETREMIKNLYISCEKKYLEGIEKYGHIKNYLSQLRRTQIKSGEI